MYFPESTLQLSINWLVTCIFGASYDG